MDLALFSQVRDDVRVLKRHERAQGRFHQNGIITARKFQQIGLIRTKVVSIVMLEDHQGGKPSGASRFGCSNDVHEQTGACRCEGR